LGEVEEFELADSLDIDRSVLHGAMAMPVKANLVRRVSRGDQMFYRLENSAAAGERSGAGWLRGLMPDGVTPAVVKPSLTTENTTTGAAAGIEQIPQFLPLKANEPTLEEDAEHDEIVNRLLHAQPDDELQDELRDEEPPEPIYGFYSNGELIVLQQDQVIRFGPEEAVKLKRFLNKVMP
jgi:hypothetical protein